MFSTLCGGLLCAALCATAIGADVPSPQASVYGVTIGGFLSRFFGESQSGPETPLSNTRYQDTFETGGGFRLEGYRAVDPNLRLQVGLVHSRWSGRTFVGGEFPSGARFSDFSLNGLYIGGRYAASLDSAWAPYVLGNFGLVHLSSVTVDVGGTTSPYWTGNWRDYLEVGAGVSRRIGERQAMTVDVRLQVFGAPKPARYPIAAATGAVALMLNLGYEFEMR